MTWRTYPEYKYSGIEWLGDIPAHWETKKLFYCFKQIGSGTTPNTENELYYRDGIIPWITTSELREKIITESSEKVSQKAVQDHSSLKIYPKDTLLIAMYGATIGRLGILGIKACVNQACCALAKPACVTSDFIFFSLQAFKNNLVQLSSGGGQPNINQEKITSFKVCIPTVSEQNVIVSFLKRKTEEIDYLIHKNERLIALLQEKRQTLINHVVAKGLNHAAPMKDSGIEWLGQIPAHWNVKKFKYLGKFIGGGTPLKENLEFWNGNIPWVSPKDMKTELIEDTEDHISQEALSESTTNLVPQNCLLLVVRSGIIRHSIPVALAGREMALNQDMKAFIPSKAIMSEYVFSLIKGNQPAFLNIWSKQGATVESLEMELVTQTLFPLPPKSEQQEIVVFLAEQTKKIDRLIEKASLQIERLKEHRFALISAAVTGNIDTRQSAEIIDFPAHKVRPSNTAVMAAEIVDQSRDDPNFGITKAMKNFYGGYAYACLPEFEGNWQQMPRGPAAKDLQEKIEKEFKEQGWFELDTTDTMHKFRRLAHAGEHKAFLDEIPADKRQRLQAVTDIFKPLNTRKSEIIATLYAVWNNMLLDGEAIADSKIIEDAKNWHEEKKHIKHAQWEWGLKYMRDYNFTPSGTGRHTKPQRTMFQ